MGDVIRGGWDDVEKTKGARRKSASHEPVYQLKVVLIGSKPPIWRRLLVRRDVTLEMLHYIIQEAMGWTNSHLHLFEVKGHQYSLPEFELDGTMNASRVKLHQIAAQPKTKFRYEYDMGDGWLHEIILEKILPAEAGQQYPDCVGGARACPPEDCGGVWGYEELLAATHDSTHERHEELMEWLGGSFDPEAFDLKEIRKLLKKLT